MVKTWTNMSTSKKNKQKKQKEKEKHELWGGKRTRTTTRPEFQPQNMKGWRSGVDSYRSVQIITLKPLRLVKVEERWWLFVVLIYSLKMQQDTNEAKDKHKVKMRLNTFNENGEKQNKWINSHFLLNFHCCAFFLKLFSYYIL